MSRTGMKGKKVDNVLAANEEKPTNSASTNVQSGSKRGRARKKDIENKVSKLADVNEEIPPEDLPSVSQKNQVKGRRNRNLEEENSANANNIVKNGLSSEETKPNAPNIKKMGRTKKNHTEVDMKLAEVNGKSASEDSSMPSEENKVNVPHSSDDAYVQDVQKRKNAAVEESQDSLQNNSVPSNIGSKEKNKKLAPTKLGRKKKVDEETATEDLKLDAPISEYKEEAKPPVKRGRKNLKSKKDAESDGTETMIVATNTNVPEVSIEANVVEKPASKVAGKRGRKKLETSEEVENLKRAKVKTDENTASNMKDENVADLLLAESNTEIDKEGELSDIETKAKESSPKNLVLKKRGRGAINKIPAVGTKSCFVKLDRDEVAENAAQEIHSKLSRKETDESKIKKTAENGNNGESSRGRNKRRKGAEEEDSDGSKTKTTKHGNSEESSTGKNKSEKGAKEDDSDDSKNKKTAKNGDSGESSKRKNKRGKDANEDDSKPSKVPKKTTKSSAAKNIAKTPEMEALDFSNTSTDSSGKPWNMKISSWNINGVRAWLEKDGMSYIHHENPDIITLQETKCSDDKFPDEIGKIDNYHSYFVSGDKEGYSGVCLLSKQKPIEVKYGIGIDLHDNEGRVITVEYEKFFLVAAYVPNAGRGLIRLEYRTQWDQDFRSYLKELDSKKPVVLCGDLNVAHEEIDLANPKTNKKNAGFTKEEREGFSKLLEEGFIDTFRQLYPDAKGAYTFWTYMMNARLKNVGWRLDYFVISKRLSDSLCDSIIRKDVYGSDHCPITLFLAL